jgi:hypothetical protein
LNIAKGDDIQRNRDEAGILRRFSDHMQQIMISQTYKFALQVKLLTYMMKAPWPKKSMKPQSLN